MRFTRRRFFQAAGAAAVGFSVPLKAQTGPIRLGLMTVKTGPLASGGIDMERALVMYLKERNGTLAGRKIELFVGDSGGVPAQARTKVQELVEPPAKRSRWTTTSGNSSCRPCRWPPRRT